jgi:hypothetical protein
MTTSPNLLDVLTREGVLISVSVRYWRGCKKLRPEDIGLEAGALSDRLISLGHKRLLPKEATAGLALVESRAHALVEANTFPFLNGLARFLPNTRLSDVTAKLSELQAQFWTAKQRFTERYAGLRDAALVEWRQMARGLVRDPDRLIATIEQSFPPVQRLERSFGLDQQLFQIAVPERLGLDLVTAADQQQLIEARQQAVTAAAAQIRQGAQSFVADCVAALREQTAQLCDDMLHSIQTGESGVHQRTLNRLVHFIDEFKQMNFANDTEMEQRLEQVRRELLGRTAEQYRDSATARSQLVQGLGRLGDEARRLAQQDTAELVQRFGQLGRRKFNLAAA